MDLTAPARTSHAIVLGASMAGLLTARILSAHFDQVTIVERDPVVDRPEARKGQPQTRHLRFPQTTGPEPAGVDLLNRYFQKRAHVDITYDWKIRAEKPVLKHLSLLLKPIVAANHRWAMARGEESLTLELLRRRAHDERERAAIPAPPGPTLWARRAVSKL